MATPNEDAEELLAKKKLQPSVQEATPAKREPLEGGFEVEFVDPPKELQSECPVCLVVLREPFQATCCGYSFCKSCIARLKREKKPCPTCNSSEYDIFTDKRLQRGLYAHKVWCPNKQDGCSWVGELSELERHLNENPPSPDKRLEGCQYTTLTCRYCEDGRPRKDIEEHELSDCIFRPHSCEYCCEYQGTMHEVSVNHWPMCPNFPVDCPNECGTQLERRQLQDHLDNQCPKSTLRCKFEFAGCNVQLRPSEAETHIRENLTSHMLLMANKQQEQGSEISDLKLTLKASAEKVSALEREREELSGVVSAQAQTIDTLTHNISRLRLRQEYNRKAIQNLQEHSAIAPIIFTLDDFDERLKNKDMGWSPPPFYTMPQGYKMLLCVDVYGNGTGKGTHMSVFLSLLKGEYDEHLKWPFRASVTVRLENQADEQNHYEEVIKYHDNTPDVTAGRVMEEARRGRPWGKGKFIAHADLYNKYLRDSCLRIGISRVEMY